MSVVVRINCDHAGCTAEIAIPTEWSRRFRFQDPVFEEAELAVGWLVDDQIGLTSCPDHHPSPRPVSRAEWMRLTYRTEPSIGWAAATNVHDRDEPLCSAVPGCLYAPGHPGCCRYRLQGDP